MFGYGPSRSEYALGAYGVEREAHRVWAFVNHEGEFAAKALDAFQCLPGILGAKGRRAAQQRPDHQGGHTFLCHHDCVPFLMEE